jgi:hypothetical protein
LKLYNLSCIYIFNSWIYFILLDLNQLKLDIVKSNKIFFKKNNTKFVDEDLKMKEELTLNGNRKSMNGFKDHLHPEVKI